MDEKLPLQGLGAEEPAGQEDPAGQAYCCAFARVATGQKKPATQGLAVLDVLPVARHLPAEQAEQAEAPLALKEPAVQGVPALLPGGQKEPAGHVCCAWPSAQKKVAGQGFAVAAVLPVVAQ